MATIPITTSQNVTIECELANLRERFFARLIDVIIMLFLWFFLIYYDFFTYDGYGRFGYMFVATFPIWFTIVYDLCCEVWMNGQTLGKKTQNIRVVRVDGRDAHFSDYLLRAIMLILDLILTLGSFGYLLIFITPRHQRFGDLAAGTTVLQLSNKGFYVQDIVNLHSKTTEDVQYPEVQALTENDMLAIKNLIIRYRKYPNEAHEGALVDLYVRLCEQLQIQQHTHTPYAILETFRTWISDYVTLTR